MSAAMKLDYPDDPPDYVTREVPCEVCGGARYLPSESGLDAEIGCPGCNATGTQDRRIPLRQALWELAQASPGSDRGQGEVG